MKKPLAIVITGPTASGKSALAVTLAKELKTEIISADSRQIYKGIPIVTATPTFEERQNVPHHLIETLNLTDYYSASCFEQDAVRLLKKIFKDRSTAIVCGGSMLYIDALTEGIDDLPTVPENVRNSLMLEWHYQGDDWLLSNLKRLDPVYYEQVDKRNLKRVFHAIEVSITAGQPYTNLLKKEKPKREFNILKICLEGDRELLFHKINRRVLNMINAGLEEEARSVYNLRHLNSLNTVGLKELFAWFENKMTKEEAISRIQKNTRVYAKKQITWFKNDKKAIRLDFAESPEVNTKKIIELISSFSYNS